MMDLWLSTIRPVLADLVLPPVPFFALILVAVYLVKESPRASRVAALVGIAGLWATSCLGPAEIAGRTLLEQFAPLSSESIHEMRKAPVISRRTGVIALGSGVQAFAPEYSGPKLTGESLERLLYAIRLGRELGAPVGFSGGLGWAAEPGPTEAATAQQTASQDFGVTLRWVEGRSRDTRENAGATVSLLLADGVRLIVVVTSAAHMQRSISAFAHAAKQAGAPDLILVPAPMNFSPRSRSRFFDWVPSAEGFSHFRVVLREYVLALGGA